jgi:protein-S-isoprenylcysteine O-methyltransferase Ste14
MLVRVTFAVLFVLWCVLHLRLLDRVFGFGLPYVLRIPGSLMIALESGLVLWCAGILANVGIFESAGNRTFPREFVAIGPFRYIRNPMSFGATALFVGVGLWSRSVSVLLFSALLFLISHFVAIRIEEPGLKRRFGSSYSAYKQTVGRWIPKVGRSRNEQVLGESADSR